MLLFRLHSENELCGAQIFYSSTNGKVPDTNIVMADGTNSSYINGRKETLNGTIIMRAYGNVYAHDSEDLQVTLPINDEVNLDLVSFSGYSKFPNVKVILTHKRGNRAEKQLIGVVGTNGQEKEIRNRTLITGDILLLDCLVDNRNSDKEIVSRYERFLSLWGL